MEGTIGPAGASDEPYQAPTALQDFETSNLVIPAGTDWSSDPHVLETFILPVGRAVVANVFLEVDDHLALGAGGFLTLSVNDLVQGGDAAATEISGDAGGDWDCSSALKTAQSLRSPAAYPASDITLSILLWKSPAAADITVVRARASLLVM